MMDYLEEFKAKLKKNLDNMMLLGSDEVLGDLKANLIRFKETNDQSALIDIQKILDPIRKSYTNLAAFFTSSTNQYMYNVMPEFFLIADIRYCVVIGNTYSNILSNLCELAIFSVSNSSSTKININGEVSLTVFVDILNSLLIVFYNVMKEDCDSNPTKEEIEEYILSILEKDKEHPAYNWTNDKKEQLVETYLRLLSELDSLLC
ncbi:hypothetical protein M3231_05595 [Neobacillus mesonae]|nr:hypothetical protein [Neobacillus mesonae]